MQHQGSFGIIVHAGKALMMLRDDIPTIQSPNTWCFIGGRHDEGESYEETFLREAEEEIGVRPSTYAFLNTMEIGDKSYTVYAATLSDAEAAAVSLQDEGQRLEFLSWEGMNEVPIAFSHKIFIERNSELIRQLLKGVL